MLTAYQKPDHGELRKFGFLFGAFFAVIFGVLIPLLRIGWEPLLNDLALWPRWPWIVGAVVAAWAAIHAGSLHLLHRPWMAFAEVAGWINTRIIMVLMFYLMILPVGLLMRLFRYDPMHRKLDKDLGSYRNEREPQDPDHMRHPY